MRRDPESIVHQARQIVDPVRRSTFLDGACGPDAGLRAVVERLLRADDKAEIFHPTPASSTAETLDHRRSHDETTPLGSRSGVAVNFEQPGTIIGRYQLLHQVGMGGFGVVYMAQQHEPVQRMVALKIIKLGMDTHDVIARFEQERQALAMMDHPSIAKVLDAGATDTGRPYFVMELVKGVPITEFCDDQSLALRDRLHLFIQVCSAVQHAHQKGIIHRDIKPSNVLVTQLDDKPVPKVIDFGIAKATQQKLTEHTMFTQFGQFVGTPAYMSPEQVDPLGLDIDTRSDIYSLGVLLYELLTGATPFEKRTLRAEGWVEIKRIIQEQDPPRPSTRLSLLGNELPDIAKRRGLEPKKFATALRGDLDWIIMRAMEKDRARRYETATDFARDVERYLNDQPVIAGPPSVSYRLQKFVRRNRKGVVAAAIGVVAIVGFAATMAVQAGRIAAERDRANREREMSERVVEFQVKMLRGLNPFKLGESIATDLRGRIEGGLSETGESEDRRQAALATFDSLVGKVNLTDSARTILDVNILAPAAQTIETQFEGQPLVEARLQHVMAKTYSGLGLSDSALLHSQRALDLRREHLGPNHRDTLRTLNHYAMILWELDRKVECGQILQSALTIFEKEFGPEDPDTLLARSCLAILDADRIPASQARKKYEELIKDQERVLGPEHDELAVTLVNLGTLLVNQHLYAEAVPILERALNIDLKVLEPEDHQTLFAMQILSNAYQGIGRADEAVKLQLDALHHYERVSGMRHPDTIRAVGNLAELYQDQGRFQEAEPLARRTLELQRAVAGDAHSRTIGAMTDLGIVLGMLGRHQEALPYFIEAYERAKSSFGADHKDTMSRLNNLAVHYWYVGQYLKAIELFTEYLAGMERRFGKDSVESTLAMANLSVLYTKTGRIEESQAMLERALAVRTKAFGPDHPKTLEIRSFVAQVAYEKGEMEKAERLFAELLAAQKKALGPDHPYTLQSVFNLATVMDHLGRKKEAEDLATVALEGRRRVIGENHSETLDAAAKLASLQFEAGRTEEARTLFDKVLTARRTAASAEGASPPQLNVCALLLLNCPVEDMRAPAEALVYAERANAATDHADPAYLNTLAQAHFDTGQAEQAAETQRKALALLTAESPERPKYEARLAIYAGTTPP